MSPGLLAAYGSGRPEVPSAHAVPKVTSRPRQVVGTPSGRRRAGPPECAGAPDVWGKLGSGGAGCGAYLPELRGYPVGACAGHAGQLVARPARRRSDRRKTLMGALDHQRAARAKRSTDHLQD